MSDFQFSVLGPPRVWRGDAELLIGSAQRSLLMALLLARAGQTVSLTEILDVLWGEDPPATAVNVVHGHVGSLRRLLQPDLPRKGPGQWLLRDARGYRMDVDADSLDLLRFRRLTGQAAEAERPEQALALFQEALALWRGPVVAGLPLEAQTHPVFTALDRERLVTVEQAATVALRCDRAGALLPDLQLLAELHPLDEPLLILLIRALAATGRQADALRAYRDIRERLREELGVDPGPDLTEVGERLLSGDLLTAPARPEPAAPAPVAAVPAQLPSDLPTFAGRDRELAVLAALLPARDEQSATLLIGAVGGMAGIGKTTLAVHLAHQVADRYPDGQLYVNLRGFGPAGSALTPAEVVREFLQALGVPSESVPVGLDAQTALYRTLLSGRRMIVLLDNARDLHQVQPLLPGTAGCLVLVTSRNQMSGLVASHGARLLNLDLISAAEARDFLAGRLGPERVAAEPAAVDEIAERCGRLPLALAIVAARAATRPSFTLASIAAELRAPADGLDAFSSPGGDADLRAIFSWSYGALDPAAARLFRLLALHPGPAVGLAAMAGLAGVGVRPARALAAELAYANLVTEQEPRRYVVHDLLRLYAAELTEDVDPAEEREAARRRVLDHYLYTARAAAGQYTTTLIPIELPPAEPGVTPEPIADRDAALAWFTAEYPLLRELIRLAATTGHDRHTWQLVWSLEFFLDRMGHWEEAVAFARMAVDAAGRLDDPVARAHAHRSLGRAYNLLRRDEDSRVHLELALQLFIRIGDQNGEASTLNYLGFQAERLGRDDEALRYSKQALDVYRILDDRIGQAMALNSIGNLLSTVKDAAGAVSYCQQALKLFQELGDRHGEGAAWDSLGYAHFHLGQYDEAGSCYRSALEIFQAEGAPRFVAIALDHLGDARHGQGVPEAAREAWESAATIYDSFDAPAAERVRGKIVRPS